MDACTQHGHNFEVTEEAFICTDCGDAVERAAFRQLVRDELKKRFPWLGTDNEVNGADQVEAIAGMYEDFGGEVEGVCQS